MAMRYQPQGLLRLARAPLATSLRLAILPAVNRGYDAVSGRHPTVVGTKQVATASSFAGGFGSTVGAGTTDKIVTNVGGAFPATGRSYYFRARRNGIGGGGLGRLFDRTNGSTGQMCYWSNGSVGLMISFYAGGAEQITTIPGTNVTAAPGKDFDLLFTHLQVGTTATLTAYVNGSLVLNTTVTGTLNDSAVPITIGNRNSDNARGWDGTIECAYVWDGILGADAAAALYQNRYQVYDDLGEDDDLFAPAEAGAGGTASPSGVTANVSVGSAMGSAGARATPLGISATAAVRSATASAGTSANAVPSGVAAVASVSAVSAGGSARANPPGVTAISLVGQVSASAGGNGIAIPAGIGAVTSVGAPTASGGARCAPAGGSALALVGPVTASVESPPPTTVIDVTKIPGSRTVVFAGCARTVVFQGGIRTVLFAGGTRTVRF